jgi:uncharacterized protein with HEPN domain
MYNSRNILYIVSAISAIEKINIYTSQFTDSRSLLQYNNQLNFNGTITLLIAIAEEIKKLEPSLLELEPSILWQNIADMRNILAHDYRGIDPDIVFDVVVNELPKLKIAFLKMIKILPIDAIKEILQTNQYEHLKKVILLNE